MLHLSSAKTEDSTPAVVEITISRHPVKKRKQVAGFQTEGPRNLSGDDQGHRYMPKQKVDAGTPNGDLLALREKVETCHNLPLNLQACGLETVAMTTCLALARKSQPLWDLVPTAMDKRQPIHPKSRSKPGSVTTSMSRRLVTAKKSPSSVGSMTTTVSTRLAIAKRSQSSPGLVTKAKATRLAVGRKGPTTKVTQSATTRKNDFPSSLVLVKDDQSLSGPVTRTIETGLAVVTRESQSPKSGQITAPIGTHLVAAKTSQSLPGPVITAAPIQLAVTSISQSSFFPGTTDLDTSFTVATTGQSPSVETTNINRAVTETTNMEMLVTEDSTTFKDIVVRKQDGFTHIFLSTKSSKNNSLNPKVMKEVQIALDMAAVDDSKLVLLGAIGSTFCLGLDFEYFIYRLMGNKERESTKMAGAVRKFVNTFIQFKKPIIAAVNGPAIGLGASILPLCDIVWADEKAWFQTPYTTFGQSPDGCFSYTFPKIMGAATASEMFLSERKLTAREACEKGLVSQVFQSQTFDQEVMIRIKELASFNTVVLEESKALLRCHSKLKLEQVNERECEMLKNIWGSAQGMDGWIVDG